MNISNISTAALLWIAAAALLLSLAAPSLLAARRMADNLQNTQKTEALCLAMTSGK